MEQNQNIGGLLLKNSRFTEEQVTLLFAMPVSGGVSFAEVVSKMVSPSIQDVLELVAQTLGIQFMKEIAYNDIPVDLVRHLPINYAKHYEILPFKDEDLEVFVLTTNPFVLEAFDDLKVIFGKKITPILTTSIRLDEAINKVYEKSTAALEGLDEIEGEEYDFDEPTVDLLEAGDDEAPVIKLINSLIFRAAKEKASDIHIEPYERNMVVRYRVDGILFDKLKPPKKLQNAITSRIKVMGNLNIAEKRLPQDGRIPIKIGGKDIDIRLNTVPTSHGERICMRLQDRSNVVLDIEQLGFSENSLKKIEKLLEKTYGIVLVTGPTGSGKSTTLYSCLSRINTIDKNIITVEDPVEQRIQGIGQIQVNSKIGLTFANGLRAILRQDPNVIMIGEIRDLETAEIAINASLTGHLVFATLHTNDSAGVFPRLTDMGCEPFLIATSLLGIIAQRLVRVLCPHCKEPYTPSDIEIASLEITREQAMSGTVFRSVGCNQCNQKGYLGRTIIQELLLITDEIRTLIMKRVDGGTIKKRAIVEGMITFREHGIEKILRGITTVEEVLSNTQVDL